MAKVIGYKIRRKSDGKFSSGGGDPKWSRVGKTWSSLAGLHGHFAVVQEIQSYSHRRHRTDPVPNFVLQIYAGCEIVYLSETDAVPMEFYKWKSNSQEFKN